MKARSWMVTGATLLFLMYGYVPLAAPAVSPKVTGSRQQVWASAAWSEKGKCWLVAWREGFLNEEKGEIWCGRVSADGKALDPSGILVAKGKGMRDRPRVASDGDGFLVVWEDMRNGKDWDVYGARVSAGGKCLDPGGFVIAASEHNQCRPDVIFDGKGYYVVWIGFTDGYDTYGARVSSEGKVVDKGGRKIIDFGKGRSTQSMAPVLALQGEHVWLSVIAASIQYANGTQTVFSVDPAAGKAVRLPVKVNVNNERVRMCAFAAGSDGACLVTAGGRGRSGGRFRYRVTCVDASGKPVGKSADLYRRIGAGFMLPRMTMVRSGDHYLFACDYGVIKRERRRVVGMRTEIHGWRIKPDGGVSPGADKGEVLLSSPGHDLVLPSLSTGSDGSVLLVCSEVRGADDVKVVFRVLK